jgi:outer membrane biosynthesis protein TonB
MKILRMTLVAVALAVLGATLATQVSADTHNKKTTMTFDKPVEIPGQTLAAGTYVFKLQSSLGNRHIVQVWSEDGTKLIATVLAVNNYRLRPGKTIVKFAETSGEGPEALKAWFYPGDNFGQEFVYPKTRAVQLAVAENEPVPSAETPDVNAPVMAETPQHEEEPVEQAIPSQPERMETAPPAAAEAPAPVPASMPAELPHTASPIPAIALLGGIALGVGLLVRRLAFSRG